jgi:hypothetical protein
MYRSGAITGYQVMMDCLHMLDPHHPELVLSRLPEEIVDEMFDYARRDDPSRMCSNSGLPPALDQVKAVVRWIEDTRREAAQRNIAS